MAVNAGFRTGNSEWPVTCVCGSGVQLGRYFLQRERTRLAECTGCPADTGMRTDLKNRGPKMLSGGLWLLSRVPDGRAFSVVLQQHLPNVDWRAFLTRPVSWGVEGRHSGVQPVRRCRRRQCRCLLRNFIVSEDCGIVLKQPMVAFPQVGAQQPLRRGRILSPGGASGMCHSTAHCNRCSPLHHRPEHRLAGNRFPFLNRVNHCRGQRG